MMRFLRACVNFFRLGRGNDHPDFPGQPSGYPAEGRDRGRACFQVHIGVQRLGTLGPLAVRAGICLQDRNGYGATITASK